MDINKQQNEIHNLIKCEELNDRVYRKKYLGNTPRVYWNSSSKIQNNLNNN